MVGGVMEGLIVTKTVGDFCSISVNMMNGEKLKEVGSGLRYVCDDSLEAYRWSPVAARNFGG